MVKPSFAHFPNHFSRAPLKHPAGGAISFSAQPGASSTITLNGTVVTFVASGAVGNQINIGGALAATLQNAIAVLNSSADAQVKKCSYAATPAALLISHTIIDSTSNSFTLVASGASNGTVSAGTLAGG